MTTTQSTTDNPNYVTPEEAYEKFCPQREIQRMWCDGPKCMAWRWNDKAPVRYRGDGTFVPTEAARGYCGMVRT